MQKENYPEDREWREAPTITVLLQPENKVLTLPRPKTVLQLLHRLELKPASCLVIRDAEREGERGSLLTPDLAILPGDKLTVRQVTSRG